MVVKQIVHMTREKVCIPQSPLLHNVPLCIQHDHITTYQPTEPVQVRELQIVNEDDDDEVVLSKKDLQVSQ